MKKITLLLSIILAFTTQLCAQQPGSVEGIWLGTLILPDNELRLAVTVTVMEDQTLEAALTSIDQGGIVVPLDEATFKEDTLAVSAAVLGMKIKGAVDIKSNSWVTVFKQGPAVLPLTLHRVERLPERERP